VNPIIASSGNPQSTGDGAAAHDSASSPRVLVIIPTYNERESLPHQITGVREAAPEVEILVVDDNSPDGTGQLADDLAADDSHIHVMHRKGKGGLGAAYVAGFEWGLERDYDFLCEMDADGSHRAIDFPRLLARAQESDAPALVIGSRWVPGGKVENWPWHREVLSKGGNAYVGLVMGMHVRDATAGFRVFRAQTLRDIDLESVESRGYCFQVDMTDRVLREHGSIAEVPITFVEREVGESKMSRSIVTEALWKTTVWGAQRRLAQLKALLGR
jgi:dolichol-phosphate mannosyltransferase